MEIPKQKKTQMSTMRTPIKHSKRATFCAKNITTIAALLVISLVFVNCTKDKEAPQTAAPETKAQPATTAPTTQAATPGKTAATEAKSAPAAKPKSSAAATPSLPTGRLARSWQIDDETYVEVQVTNNTDKVFSKYIKVACVTKDKKGKELSTKEADLLADEDGAFSIGYTGKVDVNLSEKGSDIGAVNCSVTAAE